VLVNVVMGLSAPLVYHFLLPLNTNEHEGQPNRQLTSYFWESPNIK